MINVQVFFSFNEDLGYISFKKMIGPSSTKANDTYTFVLFKLTS